MNCKWMKRLTVSIIAVMACNAWSATNDFVFTNNLGFVSLAPNREVSLYPRLKVTPVRKTIFSGDTITFTAEGSTNDTIWFLTDNFSGATLSATQQHALSYIAGPTNSCVDVVEAWDGDNQFGRAYVNIISPADAAMAGKAVVIAGRQSAGEPLWPATDYLADNAYNTLLYRGFSRNNIQYLSPVTNQDVDGDGEFNDVDLYCNAENVSNTFNAWMDVTPPDRLFVYLVDHGGDTGGEGYFILNSSDRLQAANLDRWLDDLQNTYTTEVTVVIDCCYAGSLIDEMSYTGTAKRVLIASANTNEPAYFIAGGLVSFSDAFFSGIMLGYTIDQSYELARDAVSSYQLASTAGSSGEGIYLGATYIAGRDIPQIGTVCGDQILIGTTRAILWADDVVSDYGDVGRVWCSIIPPNHNPNPLIPVDTIPEIDLEYNQQEGRYEGEYEGFTEEGSYKVLYYARDIWDSVSLPSQSYVIQQGFDERIILAACGSTNSANWLAIDAVARNTYNVCRRRLFTPEKIFYLTQTTNQDVYADGTNDVDALLTRGELRMAVTNWTVSVTNADKLTLFLLGEGTNDTLRLNATEYITASELDSWLDNYQISNRQVNVIMDFHGSGAFITRLAALSNRICIASASSNSPALFHNSGYVNFTRFFMSYIEQGVNIGMSFSLASRYVRRASITTWQHPLLEDSGNGIPNNKNEDGLIALLSHIGSAFVTGDEYAPTIGSVMTNIVLESTNSATFWAADVTDADGISKVWCIVSPPDLRGDSNDLVQVDMPYQAGAERYEGTYTNFCLEGAYVLTYYAMDNAGAVSLPAQGRVVRVNATHVPQVISLGHSDAYEVDDSWRAASDYEVIQIHNFHTSADEDWIRFFAPTGLALELNATLMSTNLDIAMELYVEETNNTLRLVDRSDGLYGWLDEFLNLPSPSNRFYYVRIMQNSVANWSPGNYSFSIFNRLGGAYLVVVSVNGITGQGLPAGTRIRVDSSFYDYNGLSKTFQNQSGWHTVGITNLPAGYYADQDPVTPNQVINLANIGYGNPRWVNMDGVTYRGLTFRFTPYARARGSVYDMGTGARLTNAALSFSGTILGSNLVYNGYPGFAAYKQRWYSQVDGAFPTNVLLPAANFNMTISCSGYNDKTVPNAILNVSPSDVVDLGRQYLTPTDTDADGLPNFWETLYSVADPAVDSDGDGMNNLVEYQTGTNPTNASSVFAYDQNPAVSANDIELSWFTVPGRTYRVLHSDDLLAGTDGWTVCYGPQEASAGQTRMSWTDTGATALSNRCYCIEVLIITP